MHDTHKGLQYRSEKITSPRISTLMLHKLQKMKIRCALPGLYFAGTQALETNGEADRQHARHIALEGPVR